MPAYLPTAFFPPCRFAILSATACFLNWSGVLPIWFLKILLKCCAVRNRIFLFAEKYSYSVYIWFIDRMVKTDIMFDIQQFTRRSRNLERKYIDREIIKTANQLRRHIDNSDEVRNLRNITGSNGYIIGYIAHHADENIYQKNIEEEFSLTRSTVSKVLKLMEEKGLIRRESVDNDARLKKLVLTEKSLNIHKRMSDNHELFEAQITRGFTEEEKQMLFDMLSRINKNLEE